MKSPCVYIMANKKNGTLYVGVTSDLIKRVYEHKNEATEGFTKQYGCKMLVYFEIFETMDFAIGREKQLKGWRRDKKIWLIESKNKNWCNLYETFF